MDVDTGSAFLLIDMIVSEGFLGIFFVIWLIASFATCFFFVLANYIFTKLGRRGHSIYHQFEANTFIYPKVDRTKDGVLPGFQLPDTMVVFLHGFGGDPFGTWGKLPGWFHSEFSSVQTVLYSYPTLPFFYGSIPNISKNLEHTLLNLGVAEYESVVFVSHSTGTLLAKHLLAQRDSRLKGKVDLLLSFSGASEGASRFYTIVLGVLLILQMPAAMVLYIIRRVPGLSWLGWNSVPYQLFRNGPFVKSVKARWKRWEREASSGRDPWAPPFVVEFKAQRETVVENQEIDGLNPTLTNYRTLELSSFYSLAKNHLNVKSPTDNLKNLIRIEFRRAKPSIKRAICKSIQSVLTEQEAREEIVTMYGGSSRKGQAAILGDLMRGVDQGHWRGKGAPRSFVWGPVGTGKTTICRRLAVWAAGRAQRSESSPFPFLILSSWLSFDEFNLQHDEIVKAVRRYWERICCELLRSRPKWKCKGGLEKEVSEFLSKEIRAPHLLIFDGVDEFLQCFRDVSISDMIKVLRVLSKGSALVLSSRWNGLGSGSTPLGFFEKYELQRLSVEEAIDRYPACRDLIESQDLERLRVNDLLLSPLMLNSIRRGRFTALAEKGPGGIFLIRRILQHDFRDLVPTLELHKTITLLSIISWTLYCEAGHDSKSLRHATTFLIKDCRVVEGLRAELLEVVEDDALWARLTKGSVFEESLIGHLRCRHASWREALTSWFFASCFREGDLRPLGARAASLQVYEMAAALVEDWEQSSLDLRSVLPLMQNPDGNPIALGNFCGVLANGDIVVDHDVPSSILEFISRRGETFAACAFHVANTFSARAVRSKQGAAPFRRVVDRLNDQNDPLLKSGFSSCRSLVQSLAWFYSTEINGKTPAKERLSEIREDDCIRLITSEGYPEQRIITPTDRSVQEGLARAIDHVFREQARRVSVVHIVYILVTAMERGVLSGDAGTILEAHLKEGWARLQEAVESPHSISELNSLLLDAKRRYDAIG